MQKERRVSAKGTQGECKRNDRELTDTYCITAVPSMDPRLYCGREKKTQNTHKHNNK